MDCRKQYKETEKRHKWGQGSQGSETKDRSAITLQKCCRLSEWWTSGADQWTAGAEFELPHLAHAALRHKPYCTRKPPVYLQ